MISQQVAQILTDRLSVLGKRIKPICLPGLVEKRDTDVLSGGKSKSLPVSRDAPTDFSNDWKLAIPDPDKALIVYFEDYGEDQKNSGPFTLGGCRLRLVCWYNTNLFKNGTDLMVDQLSSEILNTLVITPTRRNIDTPVNSPIQSLRLDTVRRNVADPFTQYTHYQNLTFPFRNWPFGWFTLDLTLTCYVNAACIAA